MPLANNLRFEDNVPIVENDLWATRITVGDRDQSEVDLEATQDSVYLGVLRKSRINSVLEWCSHLSIRLVNGTAVEVDGAADCGDLDVGEL